MVDGKTNACGEDACGCMDEAAVKALLEKVRSERAPRRDACFWWICASAFLGVAIQVYCAIKLLAWLFLKAGI